MSSLTTSSRRYQQTQKPIIHTREPSTSSRTTLQSTSTMDYNTSTRSTTSSSYHSSTRNSERSFQEPRTHIFRAPDAANFQGNYIYSPSNKIRVINHNAASVETDVRLRSSHATAEDYKRTQNRGERSKQ